MYLNLFLEKSYTPEDSNYGMEIFITILLMFLVGSMFGYLLEVLFRRFFSAKKWVNPGFMKGPWLPLYGFGIVTMFFLTALIMKIMPSSMKFYNPTGSLWGLSYKSGATAFDLIPIAIMTLSMILLEFLAGIIFVKGFKVRLWDYSNMRGNIMGIICPLFSFFWFVVAIIFYYALNPFVYDAFRDTFSYIFGVSSTGSNAAHFGIIFFLGVTYGVMLIDFIVSCNLFGKISKFARDKGIVARYEKLQEEQKKQKEIYKEKFISMLPESIVKAKEKSPINESSKKIVNQVRHILLIDPSKTKTSDNYDESGRPKKEE